MQLTKVDLDDWSGCGTLECHHLHVRVLELNGRQLLGYKLSVVVDTDMQVTWILPIKLQFLLGSLSLSLAHLIPLLPSPLIV